MSRSRLAIQRKQSQRALALVIADKLAQAIKDRDYPDVLYLEFAKMARAYLTIRKQSLRKVPK